MVETEAGLYYLDSSNTFDQRVALNNESTLIYERAAVKLRRSMRPVTLQVVFAAPADCTKR